MGKWFSEHVWGPLIVGLLLLLAGPYVTDKTAGLMIESTSSFLQRVGEWWMADASVSNGWALLATLTILGFFILMVLGQLDAASADAPSAPTWAPSDVQIEVLAFFWDREPEKRFSIKTLRSYIARLDNEIQHAVDGLIEHEYLLDSRVYEFLCNRLMSDTVAPNRRHHEQDETPHH